MDVSQVNSKHIHDQNDPNLSKDDAAIGDGRSKDTNGQDSVDSPQQDHGKGLVGAAPIDLEKCESATAVSTVSTEEGYPEGGTRAWLVVLGSWFALFAGLGLMNTLAAFQTYTLTHQLKGYSAGTVGWVYSLYTFLAFFCGIYIGPVFDKYGPRWLIVAGCICVVVGIVLTSFCTGKFDTHPFQIN